MSLSLLEKGLRVLSIITVIVSERNPEDLAILKLEFDFRDIHVR
jgi:hypothetical protein